MIESGDKDAHNGAATRADQGPTTNRAMVTLALMLAMTVTALEQTVVSTAMPSIIAQLRGVKIYPWVFSAYLLAATVSTPLYGKLADLLGRKRVLLFGLGLFATGSMLSGMSQSMGQLIAMRVLQGLGAGAVGPIVLTMLGDMFTLQERARMQSLFSAVWGLSSLAGPAIGGVLTDHLSWRWVFFVTAPFGAVSAWILIRSFHETLARREVPPIDWSGASLLAGSSAALLWAVLDASGQPASTVIAWLAVAAMLFLLFVRRELRAVDPIMPLDLFLSAHITSAIAGSFLIGALLFGIDTYLPLYVQGVLGGTATQAGRLLTPLFLAWAFSVALAARVVIRFGFRTTAFVGTFLIASGLLGMTLGTAWPAWARPLFVGSMIVVGLGMGPTSLSYILGVQNAVDWDRRGVATGAVTFVRTMGGALGVGVLGATLGFDLSHRLATAGETGIDIVAALRPETHHLLGSAQLRMVQTALGQSLRDVFIQMSVIAIVTVGCSFLLQGGRAVQRIRKPHEAKTEANVEGLELALGSEH
jgi:MFS family permease